MKRRVVITGLAETKICFDALTNVEIDLYPEYTRTGLLVILKAGEEVRKDILRNICLCC